MSVLPMRTEKYEVTVGIIAGYQPNLSKYDTSVKEKIFDMGYINDLHHTINEMNNVIDGGVSAEIQKVTVNYAKKYGCPEGGEPCYKFTYIRNTLYVEDPNLFRKAVMFNVAALQRVLQQVTVTMVESDVMMYYFKKDE